MTSFWNAHIAMLRQVAELAVDRADEEAELGRAVPGPRATSAPADAVGRAAAKVAWWSSGASVDSTTIACVTAAARRRGRRRQRRRAASAATAAAAEPAGDTGDDDRADHRGRGDCREETGGWRGWGSWGGGFTMGCTRQAALQAPRPRAIRRVPIPRRRVRPCGLLEVAAEGEHLLHDRAR